MNHDHKDTITTNVANISDMEIMWFLMIVMFGWNLWMSIQHYKLQKKLELSRKNKK
jgi:hypothetical protein